MRNRINSILTLEDDSEYVVINQAIFQGESYLLLARIDTETKKVTDNIIICQEKIIDDVINVEIVEDKKLLELLTKYLFPQETE